MKAQFKYAFMAGYIRCIIFAVIVAMMAVFIIMGELGWLHIAAKITAVSLGGVAIAVMFAANIYGGILILRRMLVSPEAYLYLLTPVPRRKILLASVITILVMDLITMTVVITGEVWLSFILSGIEWNLFFSGASPHTLYIIWGILELLAGYLLVIMIILFGVTANRSIFFKRPASGLLAFLLACACVYAASLLQLVLIPFGSVMRHGLFVIININNTAGLFTLLILTVLEAVALFFVTSKLMERRMNV